MKAKHKQTKVSQKTKSCLIEAMHQGETEDFIRRARDFGREIHREIYLTLCFLSEADKIVRFGDDWSDMIQEMRPCLAREFGDDVKDLLTIEDKEQIEQWDKDEATRKAKAAVAVK
jgi:hypothetical protein